MSKPRKGNGLALGGAAALMTFSLTGSGNVFAAWFVGVVAAVAGHVLFDD